MGPFVSHVWFGEDNYINDNESKTIPFSHLILRCLHQNAEFGERRKFNPEFPIDRLESRDSRSLAGDFVRRSSVRIYRYKSNFVPIQYPNFPGIVSSISGKEKKRVRNGDSGVSKSRETLQR